MPRRIIKEYQTTPNQSQVVDSLDSTSTTDALSANKGRELAEAIQNIDVPKEHMVNVGTTIDNQYGINFINGNNVQNSINLPNGDKFSDTLNVGTEVANENKVNILKTKNLYDKDNETVGIFINPPTGEVLSNSAWNNSSYIKVKPNTTYTYTTENPNETISQITINYYNGNTWLSGFQENDTDGGLWNYIFTTPANCNGVRVGYRNERNYQNIQLEEGSTATSYTSFISNQININNEKYSDTLNVGLTEDSRSKLNILKSKNIYDGTYTTNAYVRKSDGLIPTGNGWSATDFIEIQPNTTYTYSGISNPLSTAAGTCFYTSTKTYISSVDSDVYTFTTPNNAKYVRISLNSSTPTNIQLEEGNTATAYEPYIVPSIKVDGEEIYKKKKVLWENPSISSDFAAGNITLNDSLANYSYYEVIYLMSKYEQLAVSSGLIPATMSTSITTIRLASGTGIIARYRDLSRPNDTTLQVTVCSQISGSSTSITTNTDRIIPYQIIGHK